MTFINENNIEYSNVFFAGFGNAFTNWKGHIGSNDGNDKIQIFWNKTKQESQLGSLEESIKSHLKLYTFITHEREYLNGPAEQAIKIVSARQIISPIKRDD